MRAVVQRAQGASCSVDGKISGSFEGPGLVVLVGVTPTDTPKEAQTVARKVANLRIFDGPGAYDANVAGSEKLSEARGKETSALDLGLPVMVVSQFTLYGDARKGNRPSWIRAAPGETAAPLVEEVCVALENMGMRVERGVFGADMQLSFTNDGPFTVLLEF